MLYLPYNGMLLIGENLPHTFQTLAIITRHQVGTVERAIKIFMKFGLIEILANHTYYMTDIQLFIGQSSTEAERKACRTVICTTTPLPTTMGKIR